jgi:anti-sigma factor ChrR (cupin superfamily)
MKHQTAADEIIAQASFHALGTLSQPEARAFEGHLAAGCEVCAAQENSFQSVVTALGLAAVEVEPPARVRAELLARLGQRAKAAPAKVDLGSFLTIRAGEGEWHAASEGVFVKTLFVDQQTGVVTSLFRFNAGAHAPRHLHEGNEQCLVVQGDFHLNEESFGPGDYTCAMAGSVHESAYSVNGALLLIVANQDYTMSPSAA